MPKRTGPKPRLLSERFWAKVDRRGPNECWLWLGSLTGNGYGQIYVTPPRQSAPAHRVSYELHIGPIPAGLTLDHTCRTMTCVNPSHLEPVTRSENTRRQRAVQEVTAP